MLKLIPTPKVLHQSVFLHILNTAIGAQRVRFIIFVLLFFQFHFCLCLCACVFFFFKWMCAGVFVTTPSSTRLNPLMLRPGRKQNNEIKTNISIVIKLHFSCPWQFVHSFVVCVVDLLAVVVFLDSWNIFFFCSHRLLQLIELN